MKSNQFWSWPRSLTMVIALMMGTLALTIPNASAESSPTQIPASFLGQLENNSNGHISAAQTVAPTILRPKPECPPVLMTKCRFVPAAYKQNNPSDETDYGNYSRSNRPANSLGITSIVQHVTEGSLENTIKAFQDPLWYASAHYVIDTDGTIYQMVPTKDIAWHAGNWYINQHSIGIEHIGFAADGRKWFTPAMYQSSALLNQWLAEKYNIPLDRQHILGHDNVQGSIPGIVANMHWEPGAFWNWQYFMTLMGKPAHPNTEPNSPLVTIAPNWHTNQPPVSDCRSGSCVDLPQQSANFIYLRTEPSDEAPLLKDPVLDPSGTTRIDDWSNKATYGQQFAVAKREGKWTGIWYGNQIGWFKTKAGAQDAYPTKGGYITPRAGLTSIPVYGRAYPEASAYAGTPVPAQAIVPLQYTISAGQRYATTGPVTADYHLVGSFSGTQPGDGVVVIGHDRYLIIQYNHRVAYVKAEDVVVHTN
jgi:N-acetyl-anhydromuramyl-L-alanine amidase AmpD